MVQKYLNTLNFKGLKHIWDPPPKAIVQNQKQRHETRNKEQQDGARKPGCAHVNRVSPGMFERSTCDTAKPLSPVGLAFSKLRLCTPSSMWACGKARPCGRFPLNVSISYDQPSGWKAPKPASRTTYGTSSKRQPGELQSSPTTQFFFKQCGNTSGSGSRS